jgi:hypothetical protein
MAQAAQKVRQEPVEIIPKSSMGAGRLVALVKRKYPNHITRAEAAVVIECDVTNIRRMELTGRLPSIVHKGIHLIALEDAERAKIEVDTNRQKMRGDQVKRQTPTPSEDGKLASRVFAEFRQGTDPAMIVEKLEVPPSTLQKLLESWQKLSGGMYLYKVDLAKLTARSVYLRNVKSALSVELLAMALETPKCPQCSGALTQECLKCNPRPSPLPPGAITLRREQVEGLGSVNSRLDAALANAHDATSVLRALELAVDPARVACQECDGPVAPFCEKHGGAVKPEPSKT